MRPCSTSSEKRDEPSRLATCDMGPLGRASRWRRTVARAHEFKLDAVINAFVQIEPGEAQLVVRAPLYLFKSVRFPVNNVEIDVDKSAPAIERALAAIEKDIALFEDDRRLTRIEARSGDCRCHPIVPSRATSRRCVHVAAPLERDTSIYIDQGYVDARLDLSDHVAQLGVRRSYHRGPRARRLSQGRLALSAGDRGEPGHGHYERLGDRRAESHMDRRSGGIYRPRDRPHPHRLRSSALPAVPRDSAARLAADPLGHHRIHDRALVHADRHGLQPGAVGRMVPALRRDGDCRIDRLHGAREHHGRRRRAAGPDHGSCSGSCTASASPTASQENFQFAGDHLLVSLFAFNVGIELGQLLVLARHAAAPCRRPAVRAARSRRHDHPLRAHRRHRLALDDRPRGSVVEDAVATADGSRASRSSRCGSPASSLPPAASAPSPSACGSPTASALPLPERALAD